jgi:hypothetical protein
LRDFAACACHHRLKIPSRLRADCQVHGRLASSRSQKSQL